MVLLLLTFLQRETYHFSVITEALSCNQSNCHIVLGSIYLYSTGRFQSLFVTDPDMVREVANCKSLDFGKPRYLQKQLGALLGTGILTANGDLWAHQRKVIAPHFFMDKVKVKFKHSALPMNLSVDIASILSETLLQYKICG